MVPLTIRPFEGADLDWAEHLVAAGFGGRWQARLGTLVDALACEGLVAQRSGERVGLLTFDARGPEVELVFIETTIRRAGIGTRLIDALAQQTRAGRLWLVTTNDNLDALRFYQRRGFRIAEVRIGAVDEARRTLKPAISLAGSYGIPIRDEIVLERSAP